MEQVYTVLLVDDEEEVTQLILQKIDWEGLGFRVIGSATNGVKALELAERYQPDVVMTDIRMPYMDGLELTRHLRKEYPSTRVLLFTGFDEFEYAKEAIHLEVEDYILKPINAEELTGVFTRLKEALDKDRAEKRNVEKLQSYYLESLPLLQVNFYTSLIEGRIGAEDLGKYMADYQIDLTGPVYCCVVFHTSTHHVPEGMTSLLLSMSVQQQVKDRLSPRWRGRLFTYEGNTVMIAQQRSSGEVTELTDECDRFCRWALRILDADVTAGIGLSTPELLRLDQSYKGAREAVSYRVLYGTSRAINIQEIAPQETAGFEPDDDADLRNLFKAIHLGEEAGIRQAVDQYTQHLGSRARSVSRYDAGIMELLGQIYHFASDNHIDLNELVGKGPGSSTDAHGRTLYEDVSGMDIHTLREWLTGVSLAIAGELASARTSTSRSYVKDAQRYVRDNYDDVGLSLDKICRALGVSASYFSTVFKKETGQSFIGYLTDYRMQQAARLLVEGDEKNYVVARRVGYEDANYFSYVFKKAFGMSPSRYRTEQRGKRIS